jgi:ornithine--oxo-acid transaminase
VIDPMDLAEAYTAHNYHPLPVVIAEAEGAWVTDVDGRRYLDMIAAYSAVNFGHRHPQLLQAARSQLERVTLTSRAVYHDRFGPFCKALAELCGMDAVLLMNTGAEAVETAVKTARKWGYEIKGVAPDRAKIIACHNNFHGRTVTLVSFSTDPLAHDNYGPYTPGFELIPFGDADALRQAIDEDTVAFLVEPVQGEAGVIVPPPGYLREVRDICTQAGILMIADEIQSGLGRTGRTFACEHEGVEPDVYVLGKALGGGILPVSAVVSSWDILGVFRPGQHGSTFGGNPLACAVGLEVIRLLATGEFQQRAATLGARLLDGLASARLPNVKELRGQGLWAGLELAAEMPPARAICERLLGEELLVKDTQRTTVRLAPPLVITEAEVDMAVERITTVLQAWS